MVFEKEEVESSFIVFLPLSLTPYRYRSLFSSGKPCMRACVRLFVKPHLLLVYRTDESGSTLLGGEVVDFVGVLYWAIVKS